MGSITSYETAGGKRYRVRYRKPDRTQTDKRGFRTKRDAELFLAATEVREATGEFVDASAARITINDIGDAWLSSQAHLKPSSLAVIEVAWRIHEQPMWGRRVLGEIRHSEVQAWVTELSSRKSATVVIRAHGVLAGIIDVAVKDRRLPSNPAREARSAPFPAFLAEPLAKLCDGNSRDELLFGDCTNYLSTPTPKDGWSFGARRPAAATDSLFPARLTPHDLRHTATSLAISAGANFKAVQPMLGHASAAMTLDTYADLFDNDLAAVASALDEANLASAAATHR